jgi:hypothetical protein
VNLLVTTGCTPQINLPQSMHHHMVAGGWRVPLVARQRCTCVPVPLAAAELQRRDSASGCLPGCSCCSHAACAH